MTVRCHRCNTPLHLDWSPHDTVEHGQQFWWCEDHCPHCNPEETMSAMQRRKGAEAEREAVRFFHTHGFPGARRTLAGDGHQPGDIDGIQIPAEGPDNTAIWADACIEIKAQATYNIPEWLRQTSEQAAEDQTPVLIVKPRGVANAAAWWVIIRAGDIWKQQP